MILGSLKLKPLRPALNQITVSFANSEYEFAADTIPVVDLDRVAYDGQPLAATFNLSGAAGKSMAGRIGQVRLKEGLGGSTLTEQRKARIASWKTTILALGTEVGQVVQVTDGEVPDGSMNFRLQSWRLNDDYTIDLEGSSVTASMYDSTAGAKPADVPSNPVPVEFFPEPLKSAWFPNQESPRSDDPLFDQYDKTFGVTAVSETVSEASRKTSLLVTGSLPINGFLGNVEPPLVRGQSQSASGGSLAGGLNFWARVYCFVGSGAGRKFSPGSNIRHFSFEGIGTNSNQITVSDIEYPAGSFDGAAMFVGDDEKTLCWQADFSAGTTTMSCGFLLQGTYNAPSPAHKFVRAKVKPLIHGGTIGVLVSAVTSSTIVCSDLAGLGDNWSQRYLTVLNKGVLNFLCGAFGYNDSTGTFTVSQNPVSAGVVAGDLLLIRLKPTTYTGLTIGDSGIVNGMFPAGAVVDAEKGLVIRGITPGQPHQLRRVVSNTATIYTVDEPFDSAPTYFIVEGPAWQFQNETSPITIPATGVPATISIPVDSLVNQPVVVGAFLIDRLGNETPEEFATIREAFIFGDDVGRFVGVDSEAFQVSPRGQALSGRIATGNRDTPAAGVTDLAFTGKVVCDGFVALKDFQDTGGAGVDDSTFVNADANAFNNTWILYRYNKALGGIEVSTAVAAGARVWPGAVIGSGGSGSTGPYVPVTGAASITLDLTAGSLFAIPLDRASTAIAATGGVSGQRWGIKLTVDGTAGRGVTWGSGFASGVLAPPGTDDISSGAAGVTFIEFVVNVSGDSECIKYSQK